MTSSRNSHIGALVERSTRFPVLVKALGQDGDSVVGALIRQAGRLPQGPMASLT